MITLYIDVTACVSDSTVTYTGELYSIEDVGECYGADDCFYGCSCPTEFSRVRLIEPLEGYGDILTVLEAATLRVESLDYVKESEWKLESASTFACSVRPPLPTKLSKHAVMSALRDLGLDVSDSGSVAFTFTSGRATVVRKANEAPVRIDIKGK